MVKNIEKLAEVGERTLKTNLNNILHEINKDLSELKNGDHENRSRHAVINDIDNLNNL